MSPKRLNRNQLLMTISGELAALSAIVPGNPMDMAGLARNARDTEQRLSRLARVVSSMVPGHQYGGLDDANDEYREYVADFGEAGSRQGGN